MLKNSRNVCSCFISWRPVATCVTAQDLRFSLNSLCVLAGHNAVLSFQPAVQFCHSNKGSLETQTTVRKLPVKWILHNIGPLNQRRGRKIEGESLESWRTSARKQQREGKKNECQNTHSHSFTAVCVCVCDIDLSVSHDSGGLGEYALHKGSGHTA